MRADCKLEVVDYKRLLLHFTSELHNFFLNLLRSYILEGLFYKLKHLTVQQCN